MRKLLTLGFVLALAVFFTTPAMACTVTCAGGASCSSTNGDCHCDGNTPHCIDNPQITDEYVAFLQTWNTPGINRVAEKAAKVLEASNANDLAAYQSAMRAYNESLQKLTKTERNIISTWEADHDPVGPRQN